MKIRCRKPRRPDITASPSRCHERVEIITMPARSTSIDDEPFTMPTPAAQRRLEMFIAGLHAANENPDYRAGVLLSLICYVDDDLLAEAIDDALRTLQSPGGAA